MDQIKRRNDRRGANRLQPRRGAAASAADRSDEDWGYYLGNPAQTHYSTLDQITPANVKNLEVAWTYDAGRAVDGPFGKADMAGNPLVVAGRMWVVSPTGRVICLDAATGPLPSKGRRFDCQRETVRGERIKHPLPYIRVTPATEAPVHRLPAAIALRQIAPVGARPQNPQTSVHKQSVIGTRLPRIARLARQQRRDFRPLRFVQLVSLDPHHSLRASTRSPMNQ